MRPATFLLATSALLLAAVPSLAADRQPYEPVIATFDGKGSDDAALKELIESLRKAVADGDVATLKLAVAPELAIYTPVLGFPEATPRPAIGDPDKRPGDQRLDDAAILTSSPDARYEREDLDGLIIDLFGMALEQGTVGVSATAGGRLCSPAEPVFDRDKALAAAAAAGVPPGNVWILSEATEFHEKPDAASPVLETLPAHSIVPFVEGSVDAAGAADDTDEAAWYSVALPSGELGYASDDASLAFQQVSICYGKVDDRWAVTAVVVPTF